MREWTLIAGLALLFGACSSADDAPPADSDGSPAQTYPGAPASGSVEETPSGLQYIVLQEGTGAMPSAGSRVNVRYSGFLLDGTPFDAGEIPFVLGQRAVIQGWDEGIAMMQVGDQRKLIIPPELAYGAAGRPPVIPENSTLVFDVELLSVD
jgi:peptidylprolyl isomerase